MSFVLECTGIWLRTKGGTGSAGIFSDQRFLIPRAGIYTIEGANQAGKSVLIKLLMGALPPQIDRKQRRSVIRLNGSDDVVTINTVRDAQRFGFVAVFQDETLIPSMTIREQLLMRHAEPRLRHLARLVWRNVYERWLISLVEEMSVELADRMKRLSLEDLRSTQAKVMDSAAKLLDTFESRDILGKLPIELSGGKRAIARIVSALLVPTARVVFLDEALTNVDRDMRPTIIAQLRDWQRADVAEGRTIVAVSHHRDELLLWQPDGRFVIEDGQIAELAGSGYTSIHRAHPKHVEAIPIYTAPFKGGTLATFPGTPLLITTKTIQQNHKPVLDEIRASLLTISGEQPVTILVAGSEDGKNFKALGDLIEEILEKGTNHRRPGAIAVIGGGALLNMACLAAGLVFRRKCPLLVIPSTLTAISDIAIGSKTSVNYTTQTNRHLKNAIGAYVDPTAVVLDRRLLQTLPHPERRLGMVECLKHGLLQSPVLFEAVAKLVVEDAPSLDECFRIACEVLHLKSRVLLHHPWETGGGRILRFGHIHGHAMERVTGFAVCHSSSVLWGMLVELRLGRNVSEQAFERMIGVIMARKDFGQELWKGVKVRDVVEAERLDPHESVGPYSAVQVPIVGYYSTIPPQQVLEVEASEEEVLKAMYEVNKLL